MIGSSRTHVTITAVQVLLASVLLPHPCSDFSFGSVAVMASSLPGSSGGKFEPNCGACMDVLKTYATTFSCGSQGLCGFHCGMLCDKSPWGDVRLQQVASESGGDPCDANPCKIGEKCDSFGADKGTVFCKKYGLCPEALACFAYQKSLLDSYNSKKEETTQLYERVRCGVRTTEICNKLSENVKKPYGEGVQGVCTLTQFDNPARNDQYSLDCTNDPRCEEYQSKLSKSGPMASACWGCYWAVKTFPLFTGHCMPSKARQATLTGPDSLGQILQNYIEGRDHAEPLKHTKGLVDELRCEYYLREESQDPLIQPRYMNNRINSQALMGPQDDPSSPPEFLETREKSEDKRIAAGTRQQIGSLLRGPAGQGMEALLIPSKGDLDDCQNLKNSGKLKDKSCEGESSGTISDGPKSPNPKLCMDHWWLFSQSMTARGWSERFMNELQEPYFMGFGPKRGATFDNSYVVPPRYRERQALKQCQCMGFCPYLKDEQTSMRDKCNIDLLETYELMRDDYLNQGYRFKMDVSETMTEADKKRRDGKPTPIPLSKEGIPSWFPESVDPEDPNVLNNVADGGVWEWYMSDEFSATELMRLDEIVRDIPKLRKIAHDQKIGLKKV